MGRGVVVPVFVKVNADMAYLTLRVDNVKRQRAARFPIDTLQEGVLILASPSRESSLAIGYIHIAPFKVRVLG